MYSPSPNINLKPKRQTNPDEIDLNRVVTALLIRWYYFLIAFIICVGLGLAYIIFALPVFQANSSIIVKEDEQAPVAAATDLIQGDLFGSSSNVVNQKGILTSYTILSRTIDRLGLLTSYFDESRWPALPVYKKNPFTVDKIYFNKFYYNTQHFYVTVLNDKQFKLSVEYDGWQLPDFKYEKVHNFGDLISTQYFKLKFNRVDTISVLPNANQFSFLIFDMPTMVNTILENLNVEEMDRDGTILDLAYKDNVPIRAGDFLNVLHQVYLENELKGKKEEATSTLDFIDDQLKSTNNQLDVSEGALQDYKQRTNIVDISEQGRTLLDEISNATVEKTKIEIKIASLDNLFNSINDNKDLSQISPTSMGIDDQVLVGLIQDYQSLQIKKKTLSAGVKGETPQLKIINEQINQTREQLLENIKSSKRLAQIAAKSYEDELTKYQGSVNLLPSKERELLTFQRQADVNNQIYMYLLQKKQETSIAASTTTTDSKVLDIAIVGDKPVAPNKILVLLIAMMLSLIIPSGVIFFENVFKSKVTNRDDVDNATSIRVIGIVGRKSARQGNNFIFEHPKSIVAECFRSIRTNLQTAEDIAGRKVMMITSTVAGEGKSFFTVNLGAIFAMQNYKVVLMGFDLRRPRLFDDFNLSNEFGISTYLTGQQSLESVIQKTPVNNLDLISAGPIPENPAELFTHKNLDILFTTLRQRYDYIIVDTPPVGVVADGYVLMQYVDMVLYMVREEYSKRKYVQTLDELYREGKFIGNTYIILNAANLRKKFGYSYGHYHGYNGKYGYYSDSEMGWIKRLLGKKKKGHYSY